MRIRHLSTDMGPLGEVVCALGMFDGVHRGHRALIDLTVEESETRGAPSAVVTFDRDPEHVLRDGATPGVLTDLDSRARFIGEAGIDTMLVLRFDERLASMSPDAFVEEVLLPAFPPLAVTVGHNFRFGKAGAGDPALLTSIGSGSGFDVVVAPLVHVGDEPVSSTRIRGCLERGRVSEAAELLGRPHTLPGVVVHGRGAGAGLGAPTANIARTADVVLPADGVYAGCVRIGSDRRPAAISVGPAPSFPASRTGATEFEAHLLGFEGDLYGRDVEVAFIERLRDQRAFEDEAALADAIRADVEAARDILGGVC